jgi:hypothetical protein
MAIQKFISALILSGTLSIGASFESLGAGVDSICIENASGYELLFVAEEMGGARKAQTLKTGETLCVKPKKARAKGTVRVFENEDAIEGCSRLAIAGRTERLIDYVAFDNCTWVQ